MKNNLRVILAEQKRDRAWLQRETGLTRATIDNIYNENTENPDSITLIKISIALGCTLDELIKTKELAV